MQYDSSRTKLTCKHLESDGDNTLTVHIIQKDAPGFRQPIQVIQDPPRMSAEEGIPFDRYRHLFIIANARPYLEIQFWLLCAGHVS